MFLESICLTPSPMILSKPQYDRLSALNPDLLSIRWISSPHSILKVIHAKMNTRLFRKLCNVSVGSTKVLERLDTPKASRAPPGPLPCYLHSQPFFDQHPPHEPLSSRNPIDPQCGPLAKHPRSKYFSLFPRF